MLKIKKFVREVYLEKIDINDLYNSLIFDIL